jgi:hypothetical protein
MAGNSNYNDVTSSPANTVNLQKANQAALVLNTTSPLTYNQSETLSVTGGSSGGAVTYNLVSGSCGLATNQLTANSGTGSCMVTATMAGNTNYNDVTSTPANTVNLQKANQAALVLNTTSPLAYNQSETLSVTGGSTGGAVTYNLVSGPCLIVTNQLTANSGTGSCILTATMAGNTNYNDVTSSPAKTVTLQKAAQSIHFTTAPPSTASSNSTFPVAATATSGLTVTLGVSTPAVCSYSAGIVTILATSGTCTVTASQAGNENYSPAPTLTPSVTVINACTVGCRP